MTTHRQTGQSGSTSLADLLEFVPDPTVGLDVTGTIVLCNELAATAFGYPRAALLGQEIEVLIPERFAARHRDLRRAYVADPQARAMGRGEPLVARRSDGSEFPAEVSLSWFADAAQGDGVVFAAVRDVSERVAQEEVARRLRDELSKARKLEGLGHLAGGIAHDFNNLLAVILNFADLAIGGVEEGSQVADDLTEIRRAAERAHALTRKLLIVGRRDVKRPDRLDLASMLTDVKPLLASAVGDGVELVFELSSTRPVMADLAQMEQVVLNLALNARDAMPGGGSLRISTADVELDEETVFDGTLQPGRYVELRVTDTGVGMTSEVMNAALDPFFTTKAFGQGTGLGLSTVYGVVRDTGGGLALESVLDVGTTVRLMLPAYGATAEPVMSDA